MTLLKNQVRLKDTMYNFHPTSGATDEYCHGLIVGVVGALMSTGMSFNDAITHAAINLPDGTRLQAGTSVPDCWAGKLLSEYHSSHKAGLRS